MATDTQHASESKNPSPAISAEAGSDTQRLDKAEAIVRRNVLWALGVGLVPLPVVDFIGVAGVQAKMLKQLSDLYGVKYSESAIKKIVVSLVAALGSAGLGVALSSTLFKLIPVVGTSLGVLSMPVVAGAFTMATGRIFVSHFESGGTILNFDAKAMREHFRAEFERAKESVTQLKKEEAAKKPVATSPVAPAATPAVSAAPSAAR